MKYNEKQLKKLLEGLSNDLINASHHFKLYKNLQAAIKEYEREINQCAGFWGLTINAHLEVSILSLCRAYDHEKTSFNLKELIQIIQGNTEIFNVCSFRERLKDNDYVESLSKTFREPTKEELEEDLNLVNNNNPLVKKLTILRGNVIAHTNLKQILKDPINLSPLTVEEVETLIERGIEIYTKYSLLFDAQTHSFHLVGEDDYQEVLRYIRWGIKAQDFSNDIQQSF